MPKRKIIKIDEEKCNGCGLCIPNCPEGAIQVIDNKARLISDLFCDGLGACLGHCPKGAIQIEEREAQDYDEKKVMGNIVRQGENVIAAHLKHLKEHRQEEYLKQASNFLKEKKIEVPSLEKKAHFQHASSGCPGSRVMGLKDSSEGEFISSKPQLKNWPVQITLIPPNAPYLNNADLLIAADCVPFAYPAFHQDLLKNKILLVGCPKLDDLDSYQEKLTQILKQNKIKSITYCHMEVPCCFGLIDIIRSALKDSGKDISFKEVIISIKGEKLKGG